MAVYIEGQERLKQVLARAPGRAERALAIALRREAQRVMNKSVKEYVPVDNGPLRASAVVDSPKRTARGISVAFGYGGAAKAYAVIQHEDLTLSHPPKNPRKRTGTQKSERPGQAKYLQKAMDELAPFIPERLAEACDAMFIKAGL